MKKSEFRVLVRLREDSWSEGEIIRCAELAGVQWDPEETELPERLTVLTRAGCYLVWPARPDSDPGEDAAAVYREAAARYNAVGHVLGHYSLGPSRDSWESWESLENALRSTLDNERAKLK